MAVSLNFKKTGEGKPLVVLHGLFGLLDNWQTFAKQMAELGYAVYTVDLRNHGGSPHTPELNYEVLSDDVVQLIHEQQIEGATLLGHSLGGKTAMYLALLHPEIISSLIVVDIAPRYYAPHHQQILKALHAVDLDTTNTRSDADKILSGYINDVGTKQFLLKNLYWKSDRLEWKFNLDAITEHIGIVGEQLTSSNAFSKPTLFIRGEKSNYITKEDEPEIKQLFPSAQVLTAPAAGHWVQADNPAWILETVSDFMGKNA
jgi:pimeloyl-ACP methyl ester carboxylesterase